MSGVTTGNLEWRQQAEREMLEANEIMRKDSVLHGQQLSHISHLGQAAAEVQNALAQHPMNSESHVASVAAPGNQRRPPEVVVVVQAAPAEKPRPRTAAKAANTAKAKSKAAPAKRSRKK